MVVWVVPDGTPDTAYVFGGGSFSNGGFEVQVDGALPADALNEGAWGVGFAVLVLDGAPVPPEGGLADGTLGSDAASHRTPIIYKAPGTPDTTGSWLDAFPVGYSCGRCVAGAAGDTFDSFEPAACDELVIDPSLRGSCNWS